MSISRRRFVKNSVAATVALSLWQQQDREAQADAAPVTGPFQPTWDSLSRWECPEWFRDAKFGIWAHWDAQCVPEMGDWYARSMYQQGSASYNYHVKTYGHPSRVGFKDIEHIWHAENWDPEHLMGLYKAAGAKYFMALGQHHDNLDCWDSKHQPWNSVAVGPKKDIVGTWAKVARAHGMRFGVSSHGSRTWSWMEPAQGSDATGPLAGVPYDGKLTKADGKGTWWEELDPQDLYAQNHAPMGTEPENFDHWVTSTPQNLPNRAYLDKFYNRIVDLLDQHHPDLLYFDDYVLPLHEISDVGLRIAAYHYNLSARLHGGKQQAVLNCKGLDAAQRRAILLDFERSQSNEIEPTPWQTDTCIGNWHYDRSVYENHAYKTPDQVIHMLVDIVSKNGNLMLNIPVRGDGTIDSDEIAFLQGMAAWMSVNSEAIYATRPWKISGEGAVKSAGGSFNEGGDDKLTAADFRFTTKGSVLYATAMGWPEDGKLTVKTLGTGAPGLVGKVEKVSLLGSKAKLVWAQTAAGLVVTMPNTKPCEHAYVLKIEGLNLAASTPVLPHDTIHAAASGTYTLEPADATLTGDVQAQGGAVPNLGYWNNAKDTVSWKVRFDAPGTYTLTSKASAPNADTAFVVDAGAGASAPIAVGKTADWDTYETVTGTVKVAAAGVQTVTVQAADPKTWNPMNLAAITLTRTGN